MIETPGRFHSKATDHVVAGANEILDDEQNKKQSEINAEVQEALGTGGTVDERIGAAVGEEAARAEEAEGTLGGRIETLEEAVGSGGSVDNRIAEEGAKHYLKAETYNKTETYSKPELNNLITTPNQGYVTVTATDQTTAATDVLPATGDADTIYRVGNWDGSQYDESVYSEYSWDGSAYVHLSTKTQIGEVFDISAYNSNTPYVDLAAALGTNGANIPQALRKGGMSVKFIQGTAQSSDNKYVQFRCKTQNFSANAGDWQKYGLDERLTKQIGKGIADFIDFGYYYDNTGSKYEGTNYNCLREPIIVHTDTIYLSLLGGKFPKIRCFDGNNTYLGDAKKQETGVFTHGYQSFFTLPTNTRKILVSWQKDTEDYSKDYIIFDISSIELKQAAELAKEKANSSRLNLFNPDDPNIAIGYLESNGVVSYLASYITTWWIPAKPNTQYYDALDYNGNGFQKVLCYNSNCGIINGSYISSSCKTFTTPADTAFVRISFSANNPKKQFSEVNTNYIPYSNDISGFIYELIGDPSSLDTIKSKGGILTKNIFPVSDVFVDNSYYDNTSGEPGAAETYARTILLPANCKNYVYAGFRCNGVYCFSANSPTQSNFLGTGTITNEQIILREGTTYFGINFRKDAQPSEYQEKGFISNIEDFIQKQSNALYGKKWCVVGDSFSEWTNVQFSDGPYKNKYKTYKFLIALRNNMVITDMTLSGRTMAYPNDHTFDNAFANPALYQTIPADADYITIMLGINDVAHLSGFSPDDEPTTGAITIGEIDSVDTGTFYGAWNVVLQWIFEHNPLAHVGIIITNGLGGNGASGNYSEYGAEIYDALKNIVKRWNIPYIDLNGGDGKTPMMHRGIYPEGTPSALIAAKWNAFATTPTGNELNGHTNAVGHEYESTFIENFLRSL